LVAAQNSNILI